MHDDSPDLPICNTCKGRVHLSRNVDGVHMLVCDCGRSGTVDPGPVEQREMRLNQIKARRRRG